MATQTSTRPLSSKQAQRLTEATEGVLERVEQLCRERPWAAILFGLGLGALVRGLFSRR